MSITGIGLEPFDTFGGLIIGGPIIEQVLYYCFFSQVQKAAVWRGFQIQKKKREKKKKKKKVLSYLKMLFKMVF